MGMINTGGVCALVILFTSVGFWLLKLSSDLAFPIFSVGLEYHFGIVFM